MKLSTLKPSLSVVVVFFVALCACAAPPPLSPRDPDPGSVHFVVQTYNVHRERWSDASTVEAIGARDAEIVCLEEVTSYWRAVIEQRYATQYPHMLFATKENAGGLAVLSHYPLEDHGVVPVPGDLHPGWIVFADTPGGAVELVVVHLRSLFNGGDDWATNYMKTGATHLDELALFMGHAVEPMPTIVLGDFNESPKGDAVRRLEDRGFTNLLPAFRPGQYTWSGPSVGGMLDMTIDHVMVDDSFEPLDAWTDRRGASDHIPVYAHVELRAATPTQN